MAAISVLLLPLKLKARLLPIDHLFGEKICFSSKVFDRFLRMFGFRGIDTDQPDSFPINKKKSVSIDDAFHFINIGMGGGEKKK